MIKDNKELANLVRSVATLGKAKVSSAKEELSDRDKIFIPFISGKNNKENSLTGTKRIAEHENANL